MISLLKYMLRLDHLDTIVENTLTEFQKISDFPRIDFSQFSGNLAVIGSGNGAETGKIIFRKYPAFFATESDATDKIAQADQVVIISASGEKHAPILATQAKTAGKVTYLLSSTHGSSADKIVDASAIFPKITEPYTYNTSTYFGYIYGAEQWSYDLGRVADFIQSELSPLLQDIDFSQYKAFFVILPNEFALLRGMVETKFIELFGRRIARDVATYEQVKHAMTVVPCKDELFICFGNDTGTKYWPHQIDLPIFDRENYGPMMLSAYWTVGQIQRAHPSYFMDNIEKYCNMSEYNISPLVRA